MRPVAFVRYYGKASTILAADQVSAALDRLVDDFIAYFEPLR